MGREMLSGPDLGGGFLFQLTVDRDVTPAEFVFHAQPGGKDANGPPEGAPEPLGYERVDGSCPLGGRVCWHRTFWTRLADTLVVRTAYNRTRLMMAIRIHRAYAPPSTGFESGLGELLDRLEHDGPAPPAAWALSGAVVEWLERGGAAPGSVRIECSPEEVDVIGRALVDFQVEPNATTSWPPGQTVVGGRAFVGSVTGGIDVEWRALAGLGSGEVSSRTVSRVWNGHTVRLWAGSVG